MSTLACPDKLELARFLLGDLESSRFTALDGHIDNCPACQQQLYQLHEASASFKKVLGTGRTHDLYSNEAECKSAVEHIQEIVNPDSQLLSATGPKNFFGQSQIPEQLGPYRILEQLGRGGMGTVYKALHQRLKRIVAIKILHPQRVPDPKTEARFHREMEAIGALDHPHIVRASDADERDGVHYLVMDYIDGLDLAQLVQRHGPLGVADACELICQAAEGLQCAHEHGLVHRDLKPSNLILTSGTGSGGSSVSISQGKITAKSTSAIVKILDFGLARWDSMEVDVPELTSADQLMGTLDYMAPEQATDTHNVDIRADIYSLGATLYKLLTGRSPLDSRGEGSRLRKLLALASTDACSVGQLNPNLPPRLVTIIDCMLNRDPGVRPATPADVVKSLYPFTAGADLVSLLNNARNGDRSEQRTRSSQLGQSAIPTSSAKTQTRRLIFIAVGVVLVALALGARIWFLSSQPADTQVSTNAQNPKASLSTIGNVQESALNTRAKPPLAVSPFDAKSAVAHQDAWAKYLQIPVEFSNGLGIKFRLIPPGEFLMGTSDADLQAALNYIGSSEHWRKNIRSESPQHRVRITQAYYLATTSVTQEQFQLIMGFNPSHFCLTGPGKDVVAGLDTRQFPVEKIDFAETIEFCKRLSQRDAFPASDASSEDKVTSKAHSGYRLPTEAEWEFACRAGTTTKYWAGDLDDELNAVAWTSKRIGPRPNAVGMLRPNPFGLYDMHGNIFQLCQNWWTLQYETSGTPDPLQDPQGPSTGEIKVARGGDWSAGAFIARAATRAAHGVRDRNYYCGFRIALSVADYKHRHPSK